MSRKISTRAILAAVYACLASGSGEARQGGDLSVCTVAVEDDTLTMSAGVVVELGSRGEAICLSFLQDTAAALEMSKSGGDHEVERGAGESADDPIVFQAPAPSQNPMVDIFNHIRATTPAGRFEGFTLVSRADDRYVVEVTTRLPDGSGSVRFYDYSAWVAGELALP